VKKSSWFLFLSVFAFSCLDDPDCFRLNNDLIGVSFGVLGSSAADSLRIEALTINGVSYQPDTVTSLVFPADRFGNAVHLEITSRGQQKIIDLDYEVKVQFVSEECGPKYILSNLRNTNHNFDSLLVVNSTPGRDASTQNIKIFRCPDPDSIGLSVFQLTMPATGTTTSRAATADLNAILVDAVSPVYANSSLSNFILPLNTDATQTEFTFDFASNFGFDEALRTLAVGYEVTTETRFRVCGPQQYVDTLFFNPPSGTSLDSISFAFDSNRNPRDVVTDPVSTNINVYRCPDTNIIQVAFFNEETATSKTITSITNDYNSEVLYEDVRTSRVQLPLNPAATSTVFTINFEDATEVIRLNYSWSNPRPTLFKPGRACSQRQVITNLTEGTDNPNAEVISAAVLYPATTNVNLEVAN
jgi:hypothetical protein